MLSGSALVRVGGLLVVAAIAAALIQRLLAPDARTPATAITASAPPAVSRPAPAPRRSEPLPDASAPAPAPPSPPEPVPAPPPERTVVPGPTPEPSPFRPVPTIVRAAPDEPQPQAADPVAAADRNAEPRAVDLVDLNAGSLAELNALKGGGSIGRAIVQHRPYASVDQLLSKRVLSRTTYQRIKDQVTARP